MTYPTYRLMVLISAAAIGVSAHSQEPATAKSPPALASEATTTATTPPPTAPQASPPATSPPVDRKKALQFGFRPEVLKGTAVFCKDEPISGTRFKKKRCVSEDQFAVYLAYLQMTHDNMIKNGCYGSDFCGNVGGTADRPRMSMGMVK